MKIGMTNERDAERYNNMYHYNRGYFAGVHKVLEALRNASGVDYASLREHVHTKLGIVDEAQN